MPRPVIMRLLIHSITNRIATVIIFGVIALAFAFARDTGTMLIGFGAAADTPVTFRRAFVLMLHRLGSILWLNTLVVVIVLITAVPFLLLGFAAYKMMLPGDINYYLAENRRNSIRRYL